MRFKSRLTRLAGAVAVTVTAVSCTQIAKGPAGPVTGKPTSQPATSASAKPAPALNLYAYIKPGMINPRWRRYPVRVYVPNSLSDTVTVIDPNTYKVIDTFPVGGQPNHVVPAWDGTVLWSNDTEGSDLTPISPMTGKEGRPVPVADPYNLYFTPDGHTALVMAEALHRIDMRDPHTMRLRYSIPVPCAGVNHADFAPSGRYLVASCEFSGSLIHVDLKRRKVTGTLTLGSPQQGMQQMAMPQDVRISPNGRIFYVADMAANGVWLIDVNRLRKIGFIHTGAGAHGFFISRNAKYLYVSNRGEGSISVVDFATNRVIKKWWIPGGGSPDMGGISPNGRVLWVSGRYNGVVYAISLDTGHLIHEIPVGAGPHGLCIFPQPGRFSLGHTGNFR